MNAARSLKYVEDRTVFVIAALTALGGLIILFVAAPPTQEGLVLTGTVLSVHGTTAQVQTVLTIQGRSLKPGQHIEATVFWAEDRFIIPNNGLRTHTENDTH